MSNTYRGKGRMESVVHVVYTLDDSFDVSMLDEDNKNFNEEKYNEICHIIDDFYRNDPYSDSDEYPYFYEEDGKKYMDFHLNCYAEVQLYGEEWPATYDDPGDFEESVGDVLEGWLIGNEKDFETYKDELLKNLPKEIPVTDVKYEDSYVRDEVLNADYEPDEPDFDYDYYEDFG